MKKQTLRNLALAYSWIVLLLSPIYLLLGEGATALGVAIRGAVFLSFMYGKHNWKTLMLILGAVGAVSAINDMDNAYYLLDIAGNIAVFLYALKDKNK